MEVIQRHKKPRNVSTARFRNEKGAKQKVAKTSRSRYLVMGLVKKPVTGPGSLMLIKKMGALGAKEPSKIKVDKVHLMKAICVSDAVLLAYIQGSRVESHTGLIYRELFLRA